MPPPCHHKAWDQHVAALYVAHKKAVAEQLQKARNKVFSLHRSDETDVAEIAVSYDGTWSKRGYTANIGVGFVSVHQQRRILVNILLSMPFVTVGIKMSAPKPILDQVV
jgi:hypothetical protein